MVLAFDLDGTLITAATKQSMSLRAVAKQYGVVLEAAAIWARKRDGSTNLQVLNELGVETRTASKIASVWRKTVETPYWLSLDVPFDGVFACLSKANQCATRCILITARANEFLLRQQVRQLGLAPYFSTICCVTPQDAIEEKRRSLINASVDCFIGDSETDYEAARLAQVSFLPVSTGQRSQQFLTDYGMTDVGASLRTAVAKATG